MRVALINFYDLAAIFTPLMLGVLAVAALILDAIIGRKRPGWIGGFAMLGMVLTLAFQVLLHILRADLKGNIGAGFGGLVAFDLLSLFFNYLFLGAAILTVAMSIPHLQGKNYNRGEYYILLLLSTAGMCLLASVRDLIMVFLGLETMSIPVYALAASDRGNPKSNEAGLKYLLLGAFASAFLLFGLAFLYGAAGSTNFKDMDDVFKGMPFGSVKFFLMVAGLALFLVGFGFKIAAAPFHMWVPDVYEGAPTPITAYMAAGVKAAGFVLLVRALLTAFSSIYLASFNGQWMHAHIVQLIEVLAAATMLVGNLIALSQTNIKRLLAYSSIAHTGYLLVGIAAIVASFNSEQARPPAFAIMYYLAVYLFMTIGAFAVVVILGAERRGGEEIEDYSGLSRSRPFLAAAMAVFMFSLAGVPPLGGFIGKLYIFQAAIQQRLYHLVVIAVLNSVIAAYYYLKVIYVMYMQKERERVHEPGFETGVLVNAVLILSMVMVIIMGLMPGDYIQVIVLTLQRLG